MKWHFIPVIISWFHFVRYVTGLEKLKEAKHLITELQEELKLLQPRLVETSANTEALMIKIEQDTIQVERKKEVCIPDFICQLNTLTMTLIHTVLTSDEGKGHVRLDYYQFSFLVFHVLIEISPPEYRFISANFYFI